jgi:hypothetical protein
MNIPGYYLKLEHNSFLRHPLQLIRLLKNEEFIIGNYVILAVQDIVK